MILQNFWSLSVPSEDSLWPVFAPSALVSFYRFPFGIPLFLNSCTALGISEFGANEFQLVCMTIKTFCVKLIVHIEKKIVSCTMSCTICEFHQIGPHFEISSLSLIAALHCAYQNLANEFH